MHYNKFNVCHTVRDGSNKMLVIICVRLQYQFQDLSLCGE